MHLSTSTNPLTCKQCNHVCAKYGSVKNELCNSCYKKEYYKKNSEKIIQQNKEWKSRNLEQAREIQRNHRAKRRLINKCPSCSRICHKTKHFLEVNMCRECFEAKEKKRKYQEKIKKKKENQENRKLIRKEKSHEYYKKWYYKNKEELLERKRAKNFLIRKKDQDAFDFYLQNEKADFQKIWALEDGKPLEDIQKKVYRDLKKNKDFNKSTLSKKKIKYNTASTVGKNLLTKNRNSFDWSLLKDMIAFQEQLKIFGLQDSSLFNPSVEQIKNQCIEKDKELSRLSQQKYRKKYPEKVKEKSRNWTRKFREKVGEEEYRRIHREKQKKYYKKAMEQDPEKLREAARRSYRKNRDIILQRQKLKYNNKKNATNNENTDSKNSTKIFK